MKLFNVFRLNEYLMLHKTLSTKEKYDIQFLFSCYLYNVLCCCGAPIISSSLSTKLLLQVLPPGDWHCKNCSCKFCKSTSSTENQETHKSSSVLLACRQCGQKCMAHFSAVWFCNLFRAFCKLHVIVYIFANSTK